MSLEPAIRIINGYKYTMFPPKKLEQYRESAFPSDENKEQFRRLAGELRKKFDCIFDAPPGTLVPT